MVVFLLKFVILSQAKCVEIFSADRLFLWTHSLAEPTTSESKYSGLHFAHKPSVLLRFCFQSFLPLRRAILIVICHCLTSRKTTKKPLIFFYHRLKPQVLSFIFRYIMHLRFCISGQKIRAISIAFLGSFFARILILIIKFLVDFIWKIVQQ